MVGPIPKRARSCGGVKPESFFEINGPHPYGVQSGGNRFLYQGSDRESSASTTKLQNALTDECWINVLEWLTGHDLATVSTACRFFYVVAHTPELWRDLVLADGQTLTCTEETWKDTFVTRHCRSASTTTAADRYAPHKPISIPGIFSDYLFRQHVCRSFALPEAWFQGHDSTVPQMEHTKIDSDEFLRSYEAPNKPLLVKGGAATWVAFRRWNDESYCQSKTEGRAFRTTSGMSPLPANFTWNAYRSYCQSIILEEGPLYLFDRTALQPGSDMHNDFMADLKRTCPYWDPDAPFHDHFGLLGEGRRPDHTWLIAGPKRSGSVFHVDPNATHAWNAAITGRKRWIFYPPGCTPPGVYPSPDQDEVVLPLSIGEWLCSFWSDHLQRPERLECTAMPGDIVFVPHGTCPSLLS
jgi:Cupin-like domain/F-box-like